jgi:glucan biosynthesis protein C
LIQVFSGRIGFQLVEYLSTELRLCLAAITSSRRFFDQESRLGRFLSQQSYAASIIRIPMVVFVAVALRGIQLAPLLKFGMVAVIAVPTCFIVAYILRKIPAVSRIL